MFGLLSFVLIILQLFLTTNSNQTTFSLVSKEKVNFSARYDSEDKKYKETVEYPFYETSTTKHPSVVMILSDDRGKKTDFTFVVHCTGNLLTTEWVLTAAQCFFFYDEKYLKVYAGYDHSHEEWNPLPGSQIRTIKWRKIHEEYHIKGFDLDDFAVILVDKPFELNERVGTIKLSMSPLETNRHHDCFVVGYGGYHTKQQRGDPKFYYQEFDIRSRSVTITKRCFCNLRKTGWRKSEGHRAPFICDSQQTEQGITGDRFTNADLGAGLVCDGKVYGLIVAFLSPTFHDTCAKKSAKVLEAFGILGNKEKRSTTYAFVDTCSHIKWINQHAKVASGKEIHEGGCDKENEVFDKNRRQWKDGKNRYWASVKKRRRVKDNDDSRGSRLCLNICVNVVVLTLGLVLG